MERLDKILSVAASISRTDAKTAIRKGRVQVNGKTELSPDKKVEGENITLDGAPVTYKRFVYIMMNKPEGVVSASRDDRDITATSLVKERGKRNLFPAGRLDKNTTGFLLLTDDGDFAHRILSPSKHVEKEYEVTLDGPVSERLIAEFKNGVDIGDVITRPADLIITGENTARVILREGKYHQIKRMFQKFSLKVTALHRIRMGSLYLCPELSLGEYKELSEEEVSKIAQ